jgi:RHS repeat-associated protein
MSISSQPGAATRIPPKESRGGNGKTDAGTATNADLVSAPAISLPKGGGAIRGIGEKFAANPVTGTGSMNVPIATSPGRGGFGPQLSLSYDSGSGNGPFGFGWSLSLPSITRKTDKGLPKYQDAEDSDIFLLSGAEDLVPVLAKIGAQWRREIVPTRTVDGIQYNIQRYRPRIEGLFARIERWTRQSDGESHWRSITRDNVTTLYGKENNSRIYDPADPHPDHPTHIFSWLICESYDDKGNHIVYKYKEEDALGVDLAHAHEKNRTDTGRSANRYLKYIYYGNKVSRLAPPDPLRAGWMFEVVFDYGEGHYAEGLPDTDGNVFAQACTISPTGSKWPRRPDPFSTYRAGFEIRTYRLCQRVLMFHHFAAELGANDYLVRSTDFIYDSNPTASFIASVKQSGYRLDNGKYLKKSLPSLEFSYSKIPTAQQIARQPVRTIDAQSLENLPQGLDNAAYQWVDLDGEGLPGILTEQGGDWYYKPNLSNGLFGSLQILAQKPSLANLGSGRQQLLDLNGNGQVDLVSFSGPTLGFFERTQAEGWERFQSFDQLPNIQWDDPNLRFVDLDGDGHADALVTEGDVFTWYPSLAERGFDAANRVNQPQDEEKGPRLVFADGTQSIYLADMSGDGLTDLVRIRNGDVCYWPNLGYGHFGSRVTMDDAPWFDHPDQFDQRHIRLADIDGSGVIDILYLGSEGVRFYYNQSGNRWSEAHRLPQFPPVDDLTSVQVLDLLGIGTACLVWSSPLPGDARRPMHYIDLMNGQKPHLLVKTVNNLGAETVVEYEPSTRFYIVDKLAGKPWITRLPFPVHVVTRIETLDRISRNRFASRYAYHHGYFDGIEREFRGFGLVEQWDTEEFAALSANDTFPEATNLDAVSHIPPVHTRTWFHTGAFFEGERITRRFAGEYYREPGLSDAQRQSQQLPDTLLPEGLSPDETRQAFRALKGGILRQEVYALDGTPAAGRPYSVSERNAAVRCLQPHGSNRHAVFFVHEHETVNFHYERRLVEVNNRQVADPQVRHAMTLQVDNFGNVERALAIAYPRRAVPDRKPEQAQTHMTFTANRYFNQDGQDDWYRAGLLVEAQTYEIVKPPEASSGSLFDFASIKALTEDLFPPDRATPDAQYTAPYESWDWRRAVPQPPNTLLRLIEHVRTRYRKDDLSGLSPLGAVESLALPGGTCKLAFTPELIQQLFVDDQKLDAVEVDGVMAEGGYSHSEGNVSWWIPSGQAFFSADPSISTAAEHAEACTHFFLPRRLRDPFGHDVFVDYDSPHNLLPVAAYDELGNTVRAEYDYRVLQPWRVTDPNDNRSEVRFDVLGLVAGTAMMGKATESVGDNFSTFQLDLTQADLASFLVDPHGQAATLLGTASSRIVYDLDGYGLEPVLENKPPAYAATLVRETHVSDLTSGEAAKIQVSFSYSDGFGREIQRKVQAEPEQLADGSFSTTARWIGSGWMIFNNKGKPVRKYEPFFTSNHHFEFARQVGVSSILFYDPLTRVVATLHPNNTWEKVVLHPWQQTTWDVNDTVRMDPKSDTDVGDFFMRLLGNASFESWYARRIASSLGGKEREAAEKAALHAGTPNTAHYDVLGRPYKTIARNHYERDQNNTTSIFNEEYLTTTVTDIEGNLREVVDAQGRLVMRYDYDLLGSQVRQASMEAGTRWKLNDVTGKPILAWDSRGHLFRTAYDSLRRPIHSTVIGADPQDPQHAIRFEQTLYGDDPASGLSASDMKAYNLRGKPYRHFDPSGLVSGLAFDFKGNPLAGQRQLAIDYKGTPDWIAPVTNPSGDPRLEAEVFETTSRFDALNRPVLLAAPKSNLQRARFNLIQPGYNDAGLLEKVDLWLQQTILPAGLLDRSTADRHMVTAIHYNAKGQRTAIAYGNGTFTEYTYDPLTFRLTRLHTWRNPVDHPGDCPSYPTAGWPGCDLQDLTYTYDPTGNITSLRDSAQQTIFFKNQHVEPSADYIYDAIYRLIEATGREHLGLAGATPLPPGTMDKLRIHLPHPGEGSAMGRYTEQYVYDEVGNFLEMSHFGEVSANAAWTRTYRYQEQSLLETGLYSNRLSGTQIGNYPAEIYTHDAHGNMKALSHLSRIEWDFRDQLGATARQAVNDENPPPDLVPETTYYVYDGNGQRVRKVTERQNGTRKQERLYLGGFELYRKYNGSMGILELERESLHVKDDEERVALVETRTWLAPGATDPAPQQLVRYQLGNHLGSAALELDDGAEVISYEEYYPYGATSYQAVRSQTETPKRYRYTGRELDEENGFTYHSARYYCLTLSRWISPDPLMVAESICLYEYGRNNPIIRSDKTGRATFLDPDKFSAKLLGPEDFSDAEKGQPKAEVGVSGGVPDVSTPTTDPPPLVQSPVGGFTGGETHESAYNSYIEEEYQRIYAEQAAWDAEFSRIYAEEQKRIRLPLGTTDDPALRHTLDQMGPRPQTRTQASFGRFVNDILFSIQLAFGLKALASTMPGSAATTEASTASWWQRTSSRTTFWKELAEEEPLSITRFANPQLGDPILLGPYGRGVVLEGEQLVNYERLFGVHLRRGPELGAATLGWDESVVSNMARNIYRRTGDMSMILSEEMPYLERARIIYFFTTRDMPLRAITWQEYQIVRARFAGKLVEIPLD